MRFAIAAMVFACAATGAPARAERFWVSYEGDGLPTSQGWFRSTIGPPAVITSADGFLTIDSSASVLTADTFGDQSHPIVLGAGEHLVLEWRTYVLASEPEPRNRDVVIELVTPDQWILTFTMNRNSLQSYLEDPVPTIFFSEGFHDFRVTSGDLRNYSLAVDGTTMLAGAFYEGLGIPGAYWGDGVQGASSISEWDYVRFGVVPEPGGALMLVILGGVVRGRR